MYLYICFCVFVYLYLCLCVFGYLYICIKVFLIFLLFVFVYLYLCICFCLFVYLDLSNLLFLTWLQLISPVTILEMEWYIMDMVDMDMDMVDMADVATKNWDQARGPYKILSSPREWISRDKEALAGHHNCHLVSSAIGGMRNNHLFSNVRY